MGEDPWLPPTESSQLDIAVTGNLLADLESELEATTSMRMIPTRLTLLFPLSTTTRTMTPGPLRMTSVCLTLRIVLTSAPATSPVMDRNTPMDTSALFLDGEPHLREAALLASSWRLMCQLSAMMTAEMPMARMTL